MIRLTDNDHHLGPITYGKSDWSPLRLVFSTGGNGDDERPHNNITAYALGWVVRLSLPTIMQPHRVKHIATTWDAATVERIGRNWYYETFPREYGFSLHEGFLQIFLGPQTHDSATTKDWSKFLSWTQWRFVRLSLYDLEGRHFWTEPRGKRAINAWEEEQHARIAVPKAVFVFTDYDCREILATTHIEEREWRFGEGWFKWLSLFRRPLIRRSLDIRFSEEVGPEKGSWKGGTLGHGIELLPGELHEDAFRRYCQQEHRSKHQKFRITFVGRL